MQDIIQDEIFELFPTFVRGVIVARDVHIPAFHPQLAAALSGVEARRKGEGAKLLEDPLLAAWSGAHRQFSSNPKRFPPSIQALAERAVRGKALPFINAAVATFNIVSLQCLLPCGGDDLDSIKGDAVLGLANGRETFTSLGSTEVEHPVAGEVVYFDNANQNVMCRRWNWRNSDSTKITTDSRHILVNVDGLGEGIESIVEEAMREIARYLEMACGGSVRCELLHSAQRSITI